MSASRIARDALRQNEIADVLAENSLSSRRTVDGQSVLVEARPTNAGGIVLVQRRADAIAVGDAALRRLIVALAIAVGSQSCSVSSSHGAWPVRSSARQRPRTRSTLAGVTLSSHPRVRPRFARCLTR